MDQAKQTLLAFSEDFLRMYVSKDKRANAEKALREVNRLFAIYAMKKAAHELTLDL